MMIEPTLEERLNSEEGKKKAETLFSKQFRDYLTSKRSAASNDDKHFKSSALVKDYSTSSGETTASESSRKSGKKVRKKLKGKKSNWDYHYAFRSRLTQCSLLKTDEEVAPPEDLKPLLLNMTILLQDLRKSPSELENLFNLISKITTLVTEFIRRPLKKIQDGNGEQLKKVDKTIEAMMTLLNEYKNGPNLDSDNRIREYKRLEKEISNKAHQIVEMQTKLSGGNQKADPTIRDPNLRVRNSIIYNEKLKSDIKFNQSHVKKYKKVMLEKEWAKHKLESDLSHLRKKVSKADLLGDGEFWEKQLDSSERSLKNENFHVAFETPKTKTVKIKKGKEISKATVKLK